MTEVRRITTTPVDWGSFAGGNVLAVSTGRNRRCSIRGSRVLLLSASGTVLTDVKLNDEAGEVMDAADSAANVVACCASCGSGRGRKATLAFVAGSQLLALHELPPMKSNAEVPRHSLICLRVDSKDVAIYTLGTAELFACVRGDEACTVDTVWNFGSACVLRVARGRHPLELLALLDDGSVALLEVREVGDGTMQGFLLHTLQLSSGAAPREATFACGSTLWVLCDDLTLHGYWFPQPVAGEEAAPVRLLSEQLRLPADAVTPVGAFMAGENRTCGVHIVFQTTTAVYFRALAVRSLNGPYQPPTPATDWTHSTLLWSGHVHGFSFKQCAYELLVQSELGGSPLCVMSLRQNSSVLLFDDSQPRLLSHQVVRAAPDKLAGLRVSCESSVQEIESTAAKVSDLPTTERALSQLLQIQHSLVATLHRERELNKEMQPGQSISMQLIKRLHSVYIRLSVYRLLHSTGFGDRLDVPLREALGLEEARHSACTCQTELRSQFEREMDLAPAWNMEALSLWGSPEAAPAMCIDAILAQMRCSDLCSLRGVVQQMTTVEPAAALLVLYCVHAGQQEEQQQLEEEESAAVHYESSQVDSIRGEFLDNFCLPFSVDVWAYLAFVADHRLNPTAVGAAYGAGCPPLLDLVPGLINGLTHAGAYELVFQLTGPVLTLSSVVAMDPSVAVKLLFLAYRRGNAKVLEALYRRSRGTVWRNAATHALGMAALQTESVRLLSGLVAPQSPEESVVESILRCCPNASLSNVLLMDFYILMRRYADALRMCERLASCHAIDAQRVQVIALHLRGLMPNGNTSFGLRQGLDAGEPARPPGPGAYNAQPPHSRQTPQVPPPHASAVSGGPLKSEEQELDEDVARTTARISAWRRDERPLDAVGGSLQRDLNAVTFAPTPVASLGIVHDGGRGSSRRDGGGGAAQQRFASASMRVGAESGSVGSTSAATLPRRAAAVAASQEREPLLCEAILKRSKKPCGRERPCPYHDRAQK
ncbi:uncharacterized protein Tco025E_01986 [Trypanosoma conorhini]|uniref:Uncharacterized protein n=1 Tax=Trypanosoma conorhini TaxID=83891 RepID=A0A422Q6Z8_9TRYP|nr:uncharacterized protein Tco025E_01986 [Trypanosoma conorhini]RNF25746.1 hypothetical protein Tco025E_01986 [Trypanosoma conorhini]